MWVGLGAGVLLFLTDPMVAVGLGLTAWVILLRLKAGKPPGYLFYLAFRGGVLRFLPSSFLPSHLLPSRNRRLRLSPFEEDDHEALAVRWWQKKRIL